MSFLASLGRVADRLLPSSSESSRGVSMDSGTEALLDYYASIQGRTSDWIFAPIRSAAQEVGLSLKRYRANARALTRDNPYATHSRGLVADNVIGPNGMTYRAQVREGKMLVRDVNQVLEDGWKRWAEDRRLATVDHSGGWADVERLVVENMVTDGEGIVRHFPGFQNSFGYATQVLDADQLDDMLNEPLGNGLTGTQGREIRFGIELNEWGAPVAYWIFGNHPSETGGREKRHRIPAEQISLNFIRHRAGQPRGLSWFGPILADAKMLGGYQEAELVAARTAAAKMGFFTRDPETVTDPTSPRGRSGKLRMQATPGSIETLPVGWSFESWDPTHPTTAYKDFVKGNLRSIAAGLRVGYNTLAQDLEGVNFSSLRQGNLQERDVWMGLQALTVRAVHLDTHGHWLRSAMLSGQLQLPTTRVDDYTARKFIPRGWAWVDPKKEAEADLLAIRGGLDSRTAVVARRTGRQFEDVIEELRQEAELAAEAGLSFASATPTAAPPTEEDDTDEEDNDTDTEGATDDGTTDDANALAGGAGEEDDRGAGRNRLRDGAPARATDSVNGTGRAPSRL